MKRLFLIAFFAAFCFPLYSQESETPDEPFEVTVDNLQTLEKALYYSGTTNNLSRSVAYYLYQLSTIFPKANGNIDTSAYHFGNYLYGVGYAGSYPLSVLPLGFSTSPAPTYSNLYDVFKRTSTSSTREQGNIHMQSIISDIDLNFRFRAFTNQVALAFTSQTNSLCSIAAAIQSLNDQFSENGLMYDSISNLYDEFRPGGSLYQYIYNTSSNTAVLWDLGQDIYGAVSPLGAKIDSVASAVSGVRTSVDDVKSSVEVLNVTIQGVSSAVSGVQSSVDAVNTSIGGVKDSVDSVGTSIVGVKASVDSVNSSIGRVHESVDIVGDAVEGIGRVASDIESHASAIRSYNDAQNNTLHEIWEQNIALDQTIRDINDPNNPDSPLSQSARRNDESVSNAVARLTTDIEPLVGNSTNSYINKSGMDIEHPDDLGLKFDIDDIKIKLSTIDDAADRVNAYLTESQEGRLRSIDSKIDILDRSIKAGVNEIVGAIENTEFELRLEDGQTIKIDTSSPLRVLYQGDEDGDLMGILRQIKQTQDEDHQLFTEIDDEVLRPSPENLFVVQEMSRTALTNIDQLFRMLVDPSGFSSFSNHVTSFTHDLASTTNFASSALASFGDATNSVAIPDLRLPELPSGRWTDTVSLSFGGGDPSSNGDSLTLPSVVFDIETRRYRSVIEIVRHACIFFYYLLLFAVGIALCVLAKNCIVWLFTTCLQIFHF